MTRMLLSTAMIGMIGVMCGAPVIGQEKPDFSGTWVMDMTRSESAAQAADVPPRTPVTLVMSVTPDGFNIETRTNEKPELVTYAFTPVDAPPQRVGASGPEAAVVDQTFAKWDAGKLVTTMFYRVNGMAVRKIQTWSLDPGRQTMTVETLMQLEHGYTSTLYKEHGSRVVKDVYAKVDR